MKTITLKVVPPKWAKWVAQDQDGETYFYEHKPIHNRIGTMEFWSRKTGRYDLAVNKPRDWRKTLKRLK